ncbi:MAG TPA: vancomycin resistance protein [Epsilonproteobacteria bacterium]|nr:vancomycin resistance protein [Campylobacterota bacterium]
MLALLKKMLWILVLGFVFLVFFVVSIYYFFALKTNSYIYDDIETTPPKKAALVLGTSKYVSKGKENYFYTYRIRAAAELFKKGKVKAILVSGDNGTVYYDEATTMQKDLIKAGIPSEYITLDYAGFRTLDSVVRAKEIFGIDDYIIVSQKFHLQRALFIAHQKGYKSIGFAAKDIPKTKAAYRMKGREILARSMAFLDLYLLKTEPKFYGQKESVRYKN